jgi:RNA polymerase sigma-70 factor (ECF subfamily)
MTGTEELDSGAEERRRALLDATFTGFHNRHRADVQRVLSSREEDRGMIEDVTQESFAAARQRWDVIKDYEKPLAWVLKVAGHIMTDHQKNRSARGVVPLTDAVVGQLRAPTSPHEAEAYLNHLLRQLQSRHAQVMRLAIDGWSDHEIAAIVGLAYNTVRSYRAEARARMQQLAEDDGFGRPNGRRRG